MYATRDENCVTIAWDFMFFNDVVKFGDGNTEVSSQEELAKLRKTHDPILVGHDRKTGALFADVLPSKSTQDYSVEVLVRHVFWLGYARVKL